MARKQQPEDEPDEVLERLREFVRFGYVTGSEVARRIGVTDGTVYSWLLGEFDRRTRNASSPSWTLCLLNPAQESHQPATSIANTRIGEVYRSHAVARFVSRRKEKY